MSEASNCCCGLAPFILFSCSGAADVGQISDLAARELAREKVGNMSCLASLAAGSEGLKAACGLAEAVVVIDGCGVDCARRIVEKEGIEGALCLRVTDLGLAKGKSPVDEAKVALVAEETRRRLEAR